MYVIHEIGIDRMIDFIDRVAGPPDFRTITRLETVHRAAFLETQERVHKITWSLYGSGRSPTTFEGSTWSGKIIYGGDSPGYKNDPVEYAIYEKARGGDHDFFGGLVEFFDDYEDAVLEHFRPR